MVGVLLALDRGSTKSERAGGETATMLLCAGIILVALIIFVLKYVFGSGGPNPFEKDTREPLKKMVYDMKEKNKVLKQGE